MTAEHPVRWLCQLWGVAPSDYYRWRPGLPSARQQQDAKLAVKITAAHHASHGTYGAPHLVAELGAAGTHMSKRCCTRLMKENGRRGRKNHRRVSRTTDSRHATGGRQSHCRESHSGLNVWRGASF